MIVFDIDGVLADPRHRLHYIQSASGGPDWEAFYAASGEDTPIDAGLKLLSALQSRGGRVILLTGRSENWRDLTADWLQRHTLFYQQGGAHIIMRQEGDRRPDYEYKLSALRSLEGWGHEIALVVDDSIRVIDHLVAHGYTCLHFRRPGEQEGWAVAAKHEAKVVAGKGGEE